MAAFSIDRDPGDETPPLLIDLDVDVEVRVPPWPLPTT